MASETPTEAPTPTVPPPAAALAETISASILDLFSDVRVKCPALANKLSLTREVVDPVIVFTASVPAALIAIPAVPPKPTATEAAAASAFIIR